MQLTFKHFFYNQYIQDIKKYHFDIALTHHNLPLVLQQPYNSSLYTLYSWLSLASLYFLFFSDHVTETCTLSIWCPLMMFIAWDPKGIRFTNRLNLCCTLATIDCISGQNAFLCRTAFRKITLTIKCQNGEQLVHFQPSWNKKYVYKYICMMMGVTVRLCMASSTVS